MAHARVVELLERAPHRVRNHHGDRLAVPGECARVEWLSLHPFGGDEARTGVDERGAPAAEDARERGGLARQGIGGEGGREGDLQGHDPAAGVLRTPHDGGGPGPGPCQPLPPNCQLI